ncbi:MAG: hypothetical protein Q8S13_03550 [Dehalococcoidia bacterium]|nr:hypothetical protein [Dehalococcoidia bacterium]
MADGRKEQPPTHPEYQSPAGRVTRIFWMGFGNIALVMAVLSIYKSAGWSIADLAFWLIVGLLIGARYIDIVRYKGTTAHGEPATMAHFKRYVAILLVAGAALWAVARALGPGFQ